MRSSEDIDYASANTIAHALQEARHQNAKAALRGADIIAFLAILASLIPGFVIFTAPAAAFSMVVCGLIGAVNGRVVRGMIYVFAVPFLVVALCILAAGFSAKQLLTDERLASLVQQPDKKKAEPLPVPSATPRFVGTRPARDGQPFAPAPTTATPPATVPEAIPPTIDASPEPVTEEPVAPFIGMRTWTNRDGRTLEAQLVEVIDTEKARFRKADGSGFDYLFDKLSEADMKVIYAAAEAARAKKDDLSKP